MRLRLPVKPEGCQFPEAGTYHPRHPARWCVLRYLWTVLRTGNLYGPYGRVWKTEDARNYTCYIRFRSPLWGPHRKERPRRSFLFEHRHDDFLDAFAIRKLVEQGHADDVFLGTKYRGVEVCMVEQPKELRQ